MYLYENIIKPEHSGSTSSLAVLHPCRLSIVPNHAKIIKRHVP